MLRTPRPLLCYLGYGSDCARHVTWSTAHFTLLLPVATGIVDPLGIPLTIGQPILLSAPVRSASLDDISIDSPHIKECLAPCPRLPHAVDEGALHGCLHGPLNDVTLLSAVHAIVQLPLWSPAILHLAAAAWHSPIAAGWHRLPAA